MWLNTLRVLAVVAVIVVHAASGVVVFSPVGTSGWWAGNALNSAARWCVPVFVMISGGLLLAPEKHQGARSFYAKRMDRILIPLVFWSLFYLGWSVLRASAKGEPIGAADLVARLASGRPYYHLWYLYMLTPLYLVTPLVQRVAAALSERTLWILTAVGFILSAVYTGIRFAYEIPQAAFPFWFLPYLPYFVAGHLLVSADRPPSRALQAVVLATTALTAAGCFALAQAYGIYTGLYAYDYLSLTVIPMSISVFVLAKGRASTDPRPSRLSRLAPLTLGIYLIHPVFLGPLNSVRAAFPVTPWVWIPLASAAAFLAATATAVAIQATPYARRVI